MKLLLATILLLSTISLVGAQTAQRIIGSPNLPPTCHAGPNPQIYIDTDAGATQQIYICTSTNTWSAQAGGGGGGLWGSITGTLSNQTDLQNALNLKANLASPTFTGTVAGITKSMVGLSNVDNTSDATKNAASVTLTNKTMSGSSNTFTNLPASGILGVIPIANLATGTPNGSKFIRDDGTLQAIPGGGDALTASPLSQFAATTSAQFAGVISNETGTGLVVLGTSPNFTTSITVGDGTVAGELVAYELTANGSDYVSWMAPDAVTTIQRLKLPAAANGAAQVLLFGAPSSNISTATWSNIPYDVAVNYDGVPAASSTFRFVAPRAFDTGSSFTGTVCSAGTAATSQSDFLVKVNGTTKATLRFAASGTTCSIVGGTTTTIAATDVITIIAPASPDATLANVAITVIGTLH